MKGIKITILFSSLIFSAYAEDALDTSNLLCEKGYFPPTDEGAIPSSTDQNSNKQKNPPKKSEKKWTPESKANDAEADSSLLLPNAGHEDFFGEDQ